VFFTVVFSSILDCPSPKSLRMPGKYFWELKCSTGWCPTRHVGWRCRSSTIATVHLKSYSQEACTVLCWGACCLGLCATPLIPIGIGRVAISLSKVTNGCVTLVTKNICSWTKHGALCPRSVCIRLYQVFTFFYFCDILIVCYCNSESSRSHTWAVELLGEDFHKNQAMREVVG